MRYKLCKFSENRARDTPLRGVYIPDFGHLSKNFNFGGPTPLSLHRWGEIWHGGGDLWSPPPWQKIQNFAVFEHGYTTINLFVSNGIKIVSVFFSKTVNLKSSATKFTSISCLPVLSDPSHFGTPFTDISAVSAIKVHKTLTASSARPHSVDYFPPSVIKTCPDLFSELIAELAKGKIPLRYPGRRPGRRPASSC